MPTGVMFAGGKPYSEGRESIREVSPRSGLLGTMRQIALVLMPGALLVSDVLAVGVAALVIVSTTNRRRVTVVLPLLGFLVAAGLTVAINPSMAATTALGYIVIAAGLLLLLFSSTRAADAVPVAIGAALANVCVAALAVYQVGDRGAQASLLSFHPNMAAAWVLVSLGANLNGFRTIGPRPGFVRLLMITGVAAGLVALALTGSRSG